MSFINEALIRRNAIDTVQDYIWENLFEPNKNWPAYEFRRRCYARWAANEILQRIESEPESPILTVLYFWAEVDEFSKNDSDHDQAEMFKIAAETAEEIGSLLV